MNVQKIIAAILFCLFLAACAEQVPTPAGAEAAMAIIATATATAASDTAYVERMATLNAHETLEAGYTATPLPTATATPIELPVPLGEALPLLQPITAENAASLQVLARYYETWQVDSGLSENGQRFFMHSTYGYQTYEWPSLTPVSVIPAVIVKMGGVGANARALHSVSYDGSYLAVADRANSPEMVQVWSVDTGEKLCSLNVGEVLSRNHVGALRLEFSPDNAYFSLIGRWSEEGEVLVRLWAVQGCKPMVNLKQSQALLLPVFAPDGSHMAGLNGNKIELTPVDGSDPLVIEPRAQVFGLGWMPDSAAVIAVYGSQTVVYDAASGDVLQEFEAANGYKPALVRVSPDGSWITLVGEKTWYIHTRDGTITRQLSPEQQAQFPAGGVTIRSNEDEWLAAQGKDVLGGFRTNQGQTAVWDVRGNILLIDEASGTVFAQARLPFVPYQINQQSDAFDDWESGLTYDLDALIHQSAARRTQFLLSHNGQYGVVSAISGRTLKVELHHSLEGSLDISPETLIASSGPYNTYFEFRFSADDTLVAGASKNLLVLWETATGTELGRISGAFLEDTLFDYGFAPDGSLLLVSSIKPGGGGYWLTLLDTASMSILRQHEINDCRMSAPFAVTSDSQYVVTLTPSCRVGVYDVATWNLSMDNNPFFNTYAGPSEINFGLSADDSLLAIGYQKTLEVWSMDSGTRVFAVENLNNDIMAFIGSFSLSFSPDNSLLLVRYGQWIHAASTVELYGIPQ